MSPTEDISLVESIGGDDCNGSVWDNSEGRDDDRTSHANIGLPVHFKLAYQWSEEGCFGRAYAGRLDSGRAGMACRVAANAAMERSTPQYIKLVVQEKVDKMRTRRW
jgi:hypothetical protein